MYALIFVSLLIHEAGHLLAAYLTGMRVRSCTIMPYGGEHRHMRTSIWHRKENDYSLRSAVLWQQAYYY